MAMTELSKKKLRIDLPYRLKNPTAPSGSADLAVYQIQPEPLDISHPPPTPARASEPPSPSESTPRTPRSAASSTTGSTSASPATAFTSPPASPREILHGDKALEPQQPSKPGIPSKSTADSLSYMLLPCLQCELKLLPCDSRLPSCSRCRRKGETEGRLCIAQRARTLAEIEQDEGTGEAVVMIRGARDEEEIWRRKQRLKEELLEQQSELRCRRNWVLPPSPIASGWWHGDDVIRGPLE